MLENAYLESGWLFCQSAFERAIAAMSGLSGVTAWLGAPAARAADGASQTRHITTPTITRTTTMIETNAAGLKFPFTILPPNPDTYPNRRTHVCRYLRPT